MVQCRSKHIWTSNKHHEPTSPNKLVEAAPEAWLNMCERALSLKAGISGEIGEYCGMPGRLSRAAVVRVLRPLVVFFYGTFRA